VPNALTPSEAGENAYWDITKMKLINQSTVKVFNRYGVEVFSQNGGYFNTTKWDGSGLPAGTYYYVIDRNDGINKKPLMGDLTIIR